MTGMKQPTPTQRFKLLAGTKTLYCWASDKIAARQKFIAEFGVAAVTCELLD